MTNNDVSCFATLRKAFYAWRQNTKVAVIKVKNTTDNNNNNNIIDISDRKIQLLLNNNDNKCAGINIIRSNIEFSTNQIKVPISFHADMELSQSSQTNDSKLREEINFSANNREEIEFKEKSKKSDSIEIGSKHNIRDKGSSESIGSTVVMEKRVKKGEDVGDLPLEINVKGSEMPEEKV